MQTGGKESGMKNEREDVLPGESDNDILRCTKCAHYTLSSGQNMMIWGLVALEYVRTTKVEPYDELEPERGHGFLQGHLKF